MDPGSPVSPIVRRQFAYETSFMIIRLLQAFEDIVSDAAASLQSLPPPEWRESGDLR